MSETSTTPARPLGILLLQAGLISERQLKIALEEQNHVKQDRIGAILVTHGWVKQQSVDYFAEEWPKLKNRTAPQRLGQYLEQAALLNKTQVESILKFQQYTQRKFGTLAISNGWVKRRTINFFLQSLVHKKPQAIASKAELLREKLIENETVNPFALLLLYKQLLQQRSVKVSGHPNQAELLEMGLVVIDHNQLKIAGGLDPSLLDLQWVTQQLNTLQPYHWIRLKLFKLAEYSDYPYRTLAEILAWTSDQVDLTHKLGLLIRKTNTFIAGGEEEAQVATLVRTHILHNWQSGVAAEHLQGIEAGLTGDLGSEASRSGLMLYQRILEQPEVRTANSPEEKELLKLGVITHCDGVFRISNRIYESVFNSQWVTQKLAQTVHPSADQSLQSLKAIPLGNAERERSAPISQESKNGAKPDPTAVGVHPLSPELPSPQPVTPQSLSKFRTESEKNLATDNRLFTLPIVTTRERGRTALRLTLWTVMAGILTTIGFQLWQQSAQVHPITLSPSPQQTLSTSATSNSLPIKNIPSSSPSPLKAVGRVGDIQPGPTEVESDPQDADISSNLSVTSLSNTNIKVPIFRPGSAVEQITDTLGPPTWNRKGYYSNSRALLYEGFIPNQVDLGYLVSKSTGKLRQTEASFEQSVPLEILQSTLEQMLQGDVPPAVQEKLKQIYQRQADQHDFSTGDLKGNIHWQPEGWIYIGIWDADFH